MRYFCSPHYQNSALYPFVAQLERAAGFTRDDGVETKLGKLKALLAPQTAALVAFAREQQFEVPQEWVFEEDGYSGASLIRPGLERVRDLAAEGLIQAILVYAPDRLSRRYAYQILLIEEFARAGYRSRAAPE